MRRELAAALDAAKNLPAEDLPLLAGDLEQIRVTILARLASPPVAPVEDRLVSVDEVAKRLHCSADYVYRNQAKFPFARPGRVGGKLLFSSTGLDAYLRAKR
jgi:excisionase family DNA binding protein